MELEVQNNRSLAFDLLFHLNKFCNKFKSNLSVSNEAM